MAHVAATKRTPSSELAVVSNAGSYVLKTRMNFTCAGNGAALQDRSGAEFTFFSEVALNHPFHGAGPMRVGCAEDFVENMQVDAEFFNIVLDGGESEIDEVDLVPVDEDVVARQVSMGHGFTVKASHASTNPMERCSNITFFRSFGVEDFDERGTFQVLDDELPSLVIQIPHRRYGKAGFPRTNQQTCFAHHATNAKTVIEVGMTPRTWPSLFTDSGLTEPHPLPNLRLGPQVKALGRLEDHGTTQAWDFLKLQPHPFIEKG